MPASTRLHKERKDCYHAGDAGAATGRNVPVASTPSVPVDTTKHFHSKVTHFNICIMCEFTQPYSGPLLQQRSWDYQNDFLTKFCSKRTKNTRKVRDQVHLHSPTSLYCHCGQLRVQIIIICKTRFVALHGKIPPCCVPSDSVSQSATVSICPLYCTCFGYYE